MSALPDAMRLLEKAQFDDAAAAFLPLAGPGADGVIARFRRAECLSLLGRHDEAIEEARRAQADAPAATAPGLWLARCLAEAGRFDEAAAVRHAPEQEAFVGPVAAGYAALAKLAQDAAADRPAIADAILESRHAPLYSLALRIAERGRLRAEPRWPDLPSVWYRHECALEMEEDKKTDHPAPPRLDGEAGFLGQFLRRSRAGEAARWLHLHAACGDWTDLVADVRRATPNAEGLDESELEMLLALGRLDAADALATRLTEAAGDDASGELALDRCRLAQLRGTPARPSDFPGFDDAKKRLGDAIAWLECCAALLSDRPADARAAADRVADPSHREYVEAALLRWSGGSGPRPGG
jgi:tetratricopeptide (TPR) repeat protein